MQITHEEAHRLIQLGADKPLDSQKRLVLAAHLKDCEACRDYAQGIQEVESILIPIMKKQWKRTPITLSIGVLTAKTNSRTIPNSILVTRSAIVVVVFAAFFFSAWQFVISGNQTSNPLPAGILPVPTPSVSSTQTRDTIQSCKQIYYTVQEDDTLTSIADQFSTSAEQIMVANHLRLEILNRGMELIIPNCNFTPTGTIHPTRLATIFTPTMHRPNATPSG